jgi:hypothetical protein
MGTGPLRNNARIRLIAWVTATILAGLVVFVTVAFALQGMATILVRDQTADIAKTVTDARNSLVQLLGGVGLLGGLAFTFRTFALTRATQRADRFTKAIGQIGDKDSVSVRCGGVHSLGLLTAEDSSYWRVVEDILCALVRERSIEGVAVKPDVQAALSVLTSRPDRENHQWRTLDLGGAQVQGAYLVGANLSRCKLNGACLDGADLSDAVLVQTQLRGASLRRAVLANTTATATNFKKADLTGVEFLDADLTAADLAGSKVDNVKHLTAEQLDVANTRPEDDPDT